MPAMPPLSASPSPFRAAFDTDAHAVVNNQNTAVAADFFTPYHVLFFFSLFFAIRYADV